MSYYIQRLPGGQAGRGWRTQFHRGHGVRSQCRYGSPRGRSSNCRRDATSRPSNADETLLLGSYVDGAAQPPPAANRAPGANARFGQPNYEAVGADGKTLTFADAKDLRLHQSLMATRAGAPRVLLP